MGGRRLPHTATRFVVTAWHAGRVIVQSSKELSLPWATKSCIEQGECEPLVALDLGSKLPEMLEVVIFDFRTGSHQESTENDALVLGLMLAPRIVGSGRETILVDELVTKASVELLADVFQGRLVNNVPSIGCEASVSEGAEGLNLGSIFRASDL